MLHAIPKRLRLTSTSTLSLWMDCGSGHPGRGKVSCHHPVRPRLGRNLLAGMFNFFSKFFFIFWRVRPTLPCSSSMCWRNKRIMIDLGTGNNKINWALKDKQEFISIVDTIYHGARKGRGSVIAHKDYSTKYCYLVCLKYAIDCKS
ncbi:Spliceosomal U5 snRNP-specific 15 kDa protein, putative [Theobroma cacao]|uniref:Spliceosomal U5 snRNP-specific 15 kDa protein, putative n=1 Tax=Theobroma cacao TaxID=3641 RepID=A0A061E5Z9_THECC|nr:Spliceosomal U5 snRNP-specific 15 kDa protein, putative [Theobroma cacao]